MTCTARGSLLVRSSSTLTRNGLNRRPDLKEYLDEAMVRRTIRKLSEVI